jgi:hypothetical protein
MGDADEQMETAKEAEEARGENKKIALLIAVLALFLSFSETLGKSAQTEAVDANIKAADTWAFSQAKDIRRTTLMAAADQTALLGAGVTDAAAKAAIDKQLDTWRKTAARYESDPQSGEGLKELREHAKELESERDLNLARYHHYELASAAFQIGIVLASAAVITGIGLLAVVSGLLGLAGVAMMSFGVLTPLFLHLH